MEDRFTLDDFAAKYLFNFYELVKFVKQCEDNSDSLDDDEREELQKIKEVIDEELDGYVDEDTIFIKDRYFVDYCRELLEECGTIPKDIPWYVVIDWEATAENMLADYKEVTFSIGTFYYREV